jgi:SSS family solute:Na+ symporter
MNAALAVIFGCMALALAFGLFARGGRKMNMEEWSVAGRTLGPLFVFLLLAGEHFSAFVFLGNSGFAYGKGGPAYYGLVYGALGWCMAYWLLPPIWRYARQHGLISQPDFFRSKYDSPTLGVLVSVVGVIALIPYMVLQFRGLGIIVSVASYGSISSAAAIWLSAAVIVTYVIVSGVRGSAWTSTLKDFLILAVAVFLGIYLPLHYYGGYRAMFTAIEAARPGWVALPAKGENLTWFDSSILISLLGFFMWPQVFASIYTARAERSLRLNACILPVYNLLTIFVTLTGFAAILQVPGLTGGRIDLALFELSLKTFDPWFVGVIGSAGMLAALVPGAVMVGAAATLLANNLYRLGRPYAPDAEVSRVARIAVILVALVVVWFSIGGSGTLVSLLLMAYSFVTQLFPSLLMSLARRNFVTKQGAIAGVCVGIATVAAINLSHMTLAQLLPGLPEVLHEVNIGIVALVLNVTTMLLVSAATRVVPVRSAVPGVRG